LSDATHVPVRRHSQFNQTLPCKHNKFRAQVSNIHTNNNIHLGLFATPEEAHKAWQLGKVEQISTAIEKYKGESCYRVDIENALVFRIEQLHEQSLSGVETKFL